MVTASVHNIIDTMESVLQDMQDMLTFLNMIATLQQNP